MKRTSQRGRGRAKFLCRYAHQILWHNILIIRPQCPFWYQQIVSWTSPTAPRSLHQLLRFSLWPFSSYYFALVTKIPQNQTLPGLPSLMVASEKWLIHEASYSTFLWLIPSYDWLHCPCHFLNNTWDCR